MNIDAELEKLISEWVAGGALEQLAERLLEKRLKCLSRKEAAKLLDLHPDSFARLNLPYIDLGPNRKRYSVAMLERELQWRTPKRFASHRANNPPEL